MWKDYATGIWHQLSSWFRTYTMFNTPRCLLNKLFSLGNCISERYAIIWNPLKLFIRDRYIHMPHTIDARIQSVIRMCSSEARNAISNFSLSTLHKWLWTPEIRRNDCWKTPLKRVNCADSIRNNRHRPPTSNLICTSSFAAKAHKHRTHKKKFNPDYVHWMLTAQTTRNLKRWAGRTRMRISIHNLFTVELSLMQ